MHYVSNLYIFKAESHILSCVDTDFNKAAPSTLLAKERTKLLLEIPIGEHD